MIDLENFIPLNLIKDVRILTEDEVKNLNPSIRNISESYWIDSDTNLIKFVNADGDIECERKESLESSKVRGIRLVLDVDNSFSNVHTGDRAYCSSYLFINIGFNKFVGISNFYYLTWGKNSNSGKYSLSKIKRSIDLWFEERIVNSSPFITTAIMPNGEKAVRKHLSKEYLLKYIEVHK